MKLRAVTADYVSCCIRSIINAFDEAAEDDSSMYDQLRPKMIFERKKFMKANSNRSGTDLYDALYSLPSHSKFRGFIFAEGFTIDEYESMCSYCGDVHNYFHYKHNFHEQDARTREKQIESCLESLRRVDLNPTIVPYRDLVVKALSKMLHK